jgi:hypothetical protein
MNARIISVNSLKVKIFKLQKYLKLEARKGIGVYMSECENSDEILTKLEESPLKKYQEQFENVSAEGVRSTVLDSNFKESN